MALVLSETDVERLQAALRTLLTPWEHEGADDWSRALCRVVRDTLGVDSAVAIRRGRDSASVVADGAISAAALRQYQDAWWGHLIGERRRWARALRTWVREDVWRAEEVTRSAYYNEYCIPVGFRDSAGMSTSGTSDETMAVYVATERTGRFAPGGRDALLLSLLQPALEAGARALGASATPKRMLDSVDAPLALADLAGNLIHRNRAFVALDQRGDADRELVRAARHLAVQVGSLVRARSCGGETTVSPTMTWRAPDGSVTLDASLWESNGLACGPLCVISATAAASCADASALQQTWGLTPRETEVALLLARGCPNAEVARTLGVSEHTARRHTERVLRKMGVASRAQVAAMINGSALRSRPHARG